MCITHSPYCIKETNTTLEINYTPTKIKKKKTQMISAVMHFVSILSLVNSQLQ